MKQRFGTGDEAGRKKSSVAMTVGFLAVAGFLVFACVRVIFGMLESEQARYRTPEGRAAAGTDAPVIRSATPEPAAPAAAILTPPTPAAMASATPAAIAASTPVPTPPPTPAPTLRPAVPADVISDGQADFALLAFDENGRADWVHLVHLREQSCTVLSVPRNTVCGDGETLQALGSPKAVLSALQHVFPAEVSRYASLSLAGAADCVDAFGGMVLDGKTLDGAAAAAYLRDGGAEELLRINRQQTVMRAYLTMLQKVGWVRLAAARYTLQKHVKSNIGLTQAMTLYSLLREIDPDEAVFITLPVDSQTLDGVRCYRPDVLRVNQLAGELFG